MLRARRRLVKPAEQTADDAHFEEVLSRCIQTFGEEGQNAAERVIAAHPAHAARLRQRLSALSRLGFLDTGSDRPPATIGAYTIERRLGSGGMGVVYLARDASGSRVAVKLAPATIDPEAREAERFEREIRAIAELDHASIVPILDAGSEAGRAWFAMPYIAGATLGEVLDGVRAACTPFRELDARVLARLVGAGALAQAARAADAAATDAWGRTWIEAAARILVDVAGALHHAHERGVLHRDVKPANVLLGLDGRARLFDFGLARVQHEPSLTQSGDFTGTPYYVSPEQARGSVRALDRRADVYSLGVTLYELITLRRPFEGPSTAQILRAIQVREPVPPRRRNPLVPRDLETVCLTAMEKDPARRYATAAEFAADLQRFLDFQPVQARPVGAARKLVRWAQRNRALAAAAGLALLIAVGLPIGLLAANAAIRAQRDAADANAREASRQARTSAEVVDFLVDLFHAPPGADPRGRSARDVLERGAQRAQTGFGTELLVRAALLEAIGRVYVNLGLPDRALANFDRSFALRQRELGEHHPDVARALHELGALHLGRGDLVVARAVLERGLAAFAGAGADATLSCVRLRVSLADACVRSSDPAAARAVLDGARAAIVRLEAQEAPEAADVEERLGDLEHAAGRFDAALAHYGRAARVFARGLAPDLDARARLYEKTALSAAGAGDGARAAAARREAAELRARLAPRGESAEPPAARVAWTGADDAALLAEFVPPDQQAFDAAFQAGITALQSGGTAQALAAFERCVELRPRHPVGFYNLACAHARGGAVDAGIAALSRAVELGFGAADDRLEVALRDADIAPLREDARWPALVERMRALRAAQHARSAAARVTLPDAAAPFSGWPLLVVLREPDGARRSLPEEAWTRIARDVGAALLSIENARAPAPAWVEDLRDFVERPWSYQEPILEAVQRACEGAPIDSLRIAIVGEGSAALPAFDLSMRASGIFRAVLVLDGPVDTALARENAETASAAGLRVTVWRRDAPGSGLGERFRRWFLRFGFGARGELVDLAPQATETELEAGVRARLARLDEPRK